MVAHASYAARTTARAPRARRRDGLLGLTATEPPSSDERCAACRSGASGADCTRRSERHGCDHGPKCGRAHRTRPSLMWCTGRRWVAEGFHGPDSVQGPDSATPIVCTSDPFHRTVSSMLGDRSYAMQEPSGDQTGFSSDGGYQPEWLQPRAPSFTLSEDSVTLHSWARTRVHQGAPVISFRGVRVALIAECGADDVFRAHGPASPVALGDS